MRLPDKVVIVTGAGSGIGAGIARRLAQEGAHIMVADIDAGHGEQVARDIAAAGGSATRSRAIATALTAPAAAAGRAHGRRPT